MNDSQKKDIGNAVRKARNSLDLTQADAAEKIGVSVEFYSRIERGTAAPSLKTLLHMAVVFRVSTDELLGFTRDETAKRLIEEYAPVEPNDPPELRRLFRKLRDAKRNKVRFVQVMYNELEKMFPDDIQSSDAAAADNNADADADDSHSDDDDDKNGE